MRDVSISATLTFAYLCWVISGLLVTLTFFVERAVPLTAAGIFFTAIATVAHIKSFVICLESRERSAFKLGQDSVRSIH